MKKIISALLICAMMLSVNACARGPRRAVAAEVTKESQTKVETTTEGTTKAPEETSESSTASEPESSDKASGDILVDYKGKSAKEISENILKASKIEKGETVESYAKRFSITPNSSKSGNTWIFTWPEDKLTLFSIREVQIKADSVNNTIDENCDVKIVAWFDDADLCAAVSDLITVLVNDDHAKRPTTSYFFDADGLYQYTIETPVILKK